MDDSLRERLSANRFGLHLLELSIDQEAFRELCVLLTEVAETWRGKEWVEKEIAHSMVELLMIVRNKLRYSDSSFDPADMAKLDSMHDEIMRIILEDCLS